MATQQKILVCLIFVLSLAVTASAQKSVFSGTVLDENGAVIPGAKVEVVGVNGEAFSISTNDGGEFRFDLESGVYRIRVSSPPFTEFVKTDYLVTAGASLRLDVTLKCIGCETTGCPLAELPVVEMLPMPISEKLWNRPLVPLLPKPTDGGKPKRSEPATKPKKTKKPKA